MAANCLFIFLRSKAEMMVKMNKNQCAAIINLKYLGTQTVKLIDLPISPHPKALTKNSVIP